VAWPPLERRQSFRKGNALFEVMAIPLITTVIVVIAGIVSTDFGLWYLAGSALAWALGGVPIRKFG
jgi:hypothetical protein